MRDFLLDENGDLVLQNGILQEVEGEKQLRQKMSMLLRSALGDWFLDETEGLDLSVVLQKKPNEDAVRDEVGRVLLPLFQIVQFSSFEMSTLGRTLHIHFELATENGTISLQEAF